MAEPNIGALWSNESEKGTYLKGSIEVNGEKMNIVVFKNNYKKEEKHPDWKIFPSRPKSHSGSIPQQAGYAPQAGWPPAQFAPPVPIQEERTPAKDVDMSECPF